MYSGFFLFFALSILCTTSLGEVYELGSANFTNWVDDNPIALVMFYAPWCSHSKSFTPIFERIDKILELDSNISTAKVNCIEEKDLYWSQNIENFPTLKAYIRGEPIHYKGARELQDVVNFMRRLGQRSLLDLEEEGGLNVFQSRHMLPSQPIVVLYVKDDVLSPSMIDSFDLACKKMTTTKCAVSRNFTSLNRGENATDIDQPTLAVIRSFKHEKNVVTTSNSTKLESSYEMVQFIKSASYPSLVEFNEENDPMMFSEERPGYHTHVILIVNPAELQEQNFLISIRSLADIYNGQCVFIHIDPSDQSPYVQNILADIKISPSVISAAIIIKSAKTEVNFYSLNDGTEVNLESISYWVRDFFANRLTPSRTEVMQSS